MLRDGLQHNTALTSLDLRLNQVHVHVHVHVHMRVHVHVLDLRLNQVRVAFARGASLGCTSLAGQAGSRADRRCCVGV